MKFACERYQCRGVGITNSEEQAAYAQANCAGTGCRRPGRSLGPTSPGVERHLPQDGSILGIKGQNFDERRPVDSKALLMVGRRSMRRAKKGDVELHLPCQLPCASEASIYPRPSSYAHRPKASLNGLDTVWDLPEGGLNSTTQRQPYARSRYCDLLAAYAS